MLHYNIATRPDPMPSNRPVPPVRTSARIAEVRYEIRGDLARRAAEFEADGRDIVKLNIGNPGLFGFSVSEHVREAILANLSRSEAYCHQKGILSARLAIVEQLHGHGVSAAHPDRVFIGNGVSELIDPVSYTHLRAHETPEHLVCRLL